MTDKENAVSKVAEYVKIAETALENARRVADEAGIMSSFELGDADNVDRSIGGEYYGKGMKLDSDDCGQVTTDYGSRDHLQETDEEDDYGDSYYILNRGAWHTWQSSSEMC